MVTDHCSWRRWITRVDWPADADLPAPVKDRLAAFLARVMDVLDALAHRVDGAFDVDALAALLPRIGPCPAPWADDLLLAPLEWSASRANTGRVTALMDDIEALLAWEPEPIAEVVVMLLAERIIRAVLANRYDRLEDPDGVRIGADALEARVRQTLVFVCTGRICPSTYRTM